MIRALHRFVPSDMQYVHPTSESAAENARLSPTIRLLGYAGLIPFAFFSLSVWYPFAVSQDQARTAFVAYSAVILSFLAGIFWGRVLSHQAPNTATTKASETYTLATASGSGLMTIVLVLSNLFALVAWGALALGENNAALTLLVLGFVSLLAVERNLCTDFDLQEPQGYARLRWLLTAVVSLCHLAVILHPSGYAA